MRLFSCYRKFYFQGAGWLWGQSIYDLHKLNDIPKRAPNDVQSILCSLFSKTDQSIQARCPRFWYDDIANSFQELFYVHIWFDFTTTSYKLRHTGRCFKIDAIKTIYLTHRLICEITTSGSTWCSINVMIVGKKEIPCDKWRIYTFIQLFL